MPMLKILTPYYEKFSVETDANIQELLNSDIECVAESKQGTLICDLRNELISKSKKKKQVVSGFDYVLFIDTDIYSKDIVGDVKRMMSYDLPIVGGGYKQQGSNQLCAVKYNKYLQIGTKGLRDVDWVGAGFLLIKNEVFNNLEYPWFRYEWVEKGDKRWQTPEDVGFCFYARENGYKVYADCDCELVHIERIKNHIKTIKGETVALSKADLQNAIFFFDRVTVKGGREATEYVRLLQKIAEELKKPETGGLVAPDDKAPRDK